MMDASGRSKGCAIVEYSSAEHAQRAINELNNTELMGRLIFVREDREGDSAWQGGVGGASCKVYVGNLSWEAAWQDVKDHMRGVRADLDVLHADIMMDASGRSKGCAIVEYSSAEHAQRAINELNNTELMGRLIFVREDREGEDFLGRKSFAPQGAFNVAVRGGRAVLRVNGHGKARMHPYKRG